MCDLDIFSQKNSADQQRIALEYDEFEHGYPRRMLSLFVDVVGACLARAENRGASVLVGVRMLLRGCAIQMPLVLREFLQNRGI